MKKCLSAFLAVLLLLSLVTAVPFAAENEEITVLFTHDIHDYWDPRPAQDAQDDEYGGAARLATLLKENSGKNTLFLDGGDFSMGTLMQAGYATEAYELRILGSMGCAVTTFGNHEFDYGAEGVAKMLRAAMASGDPLPQIVQSNIVFSENMTEEQAEMKAAFEEYGVRDYTVLECGGYRVGVFGLVGLDCIDCIQTELDYTDYIEAAKQTVADLQAENADIIIALSHSGTNSDGVSGEDFELLHQVDGIDLVISSHSHSEYAEPVKVGDSLLVSCGEYLNKLGKLTFTMADGKPEVRGYELLPLDASVQEDAETAQRLEEYAQKINNTYLRAENVKYNEVIAHSNDSLIDLGEMYATHQEYNMGNVIADSYIYEAERNGINDIDMALVGLGTIRSSIKAGDITVNDVFEICSLGVGSDLSAGHPLAAAYVTGKELKLFAELDASLGTLVSSIKMSYSGLSFTFNEKRMLLDRVTDIVLVRPDGTREKIQNDKLYKVAANIYAINMLGMLNGLTKGILSITPKDADGKPVENIYDFALRNTDGEEIKEWVALKNYLMSFEKGASGYPELPAVYAHPEQATSEITPTAETRLAFQQGRKVKISESGIDNFFRPGAATNIVRIVLALLIVLLAGIIIPIVILVHKAKKRRREMANKVIRSGFQRR